VIAVTGAINALRGVSWLRVPSVHSTGDAKFSIAGISALFYSNY